MIPRRSSMSISRPARVYPTRAPLEERDRGGLGLHDDLDRLLQQRVLVRVEVEVVLALLERRLGRLEERFVEILPALGAALLDDEGDLLLAHVRALRCCRRDVPSGLKSMSP